MGQQEPTLSEVLDTYLAINGKNAIFTESLFETDTILITVTPRTWTSEKYRACSWGTRTITEKIWSQLIWSSNARRSGARA